MTVEIPARGATFTVQALVQVGHPIHLALVDAYLRGEVPVHREWRLGADSQAVVAGLVGPIVALRALGVDSGSLRSMSVLPRDSDGPISSRLALRLPGRTVQLVCTSGAAARPASWTEVATVLPTYGEVQAEMTRGAASAFLAATYDEPTNDPLPTLDDQAVASSAPDLDTARAAAWAWLENLLERAVEERRFEPIVMRLTGGERSTELEIGWTLVLPRNQRVFAAWLGSDGRLVTQLAPGGLPVVST